MRLSPSPACRDLTCRGKLVELDGPVLEPPASCAPLRTSLAVSPSTHLSKEPPEKEDMYEIFEICWFANDMYKLNCAV